jgi:hypothetical protein
VPLTPEQRSMRARIAARAQHAQGKTNTAPARRNSPNSVEYWARQVDPDGTLPEAERLKRANHARLEHMTRLSFEASKARSRRKEHALGPAGAFRLGSSAVD